MRLTQRENHDLDIQDYKVFSSDQLISNQKSNKQNESNYPEVDELAIVKTTARRKETAPLAP